MCIISGILNFFSFAVDRIIDVIAQQQKASAQGSDTSHA